MCWTTTNALIIGNNHECLYYYGSSPVRDYRFDQQTVSVITPVMKVKTKELGKSS